LLACTEQPTTIKESLTVQNLFCNWQEVPHGSWNDARLVHGWFGVDKDSIVYAEFGVWYYRLYQFDRIDKMVVRDNRITGNGWRIEFIDRDRIIFNNYNLRRE
jgi:hypothetical protein